MAENKIRIAFVNQRYGTEVNGGSEYYTMELAEHLKERYEVEVLTTKALGYDTWEDYYTEDVEEIHGIKVRRFSVAHKRKTLEMKIWNKLHGILPIGKKFIENKWIDAQGPYSPELIEYIREKGNEYDIIIFVTYLYYHAVRGIPEVADRAVLLPTAHDEPYIYYQIYKNIFELPKGMIYLTPEEKAFVEKHFNVSEKRNCIAGAGVEVPKNINNKNYREKYDVQDPYLIYVGRIDQSKGCDEMFRIFRRYKNEHPKDRLKLVLMGKNHMEVPEDPDILYQGFVSEEDKFSGISGAEALWLPSRYESLSIAVLESLALGRPVLVNGACEVLKGHCMRSNAGIFYENEEKGTEALTQVLKLAKENDISEKATAYIKKNYQWNSILDRMEALIDELVRNNKME